MGLCGDERQVVLGIRGAVDAVGRRQRTNGQRVEKLVAPSSVVDVDAASLAIANEATQGSRLGARVAVEHQLIVEQRQHHDTLVALRVVLQRRAELAQALLAVYGNTVASSSSSSSP